MKRVYYNYKELEEYKKGMWCIVPIGRKRKILLKKAINFTGDAELYGKYMLQVVDIWPISCEHNLTCRGMNRQAWIGHAAVCIALNCPEDITREAWRFLTKEQQDAANRKADEAIYLWERKYLNA